MKGASGKEQFKRWWMFTAILFVPALWLSKVFFQDLGLVHAPRPYYYFGAWFFTAFIFSGAISWAARELFRPLRSARARDFATPQGRASRRAMDEQIVQNEIAQGYARQMRKNLESVRRERRDDE